jgi:putative heme-binding domain-containing protein
MPTTYQKIFNAAGRALIITSAVASMLVTVRAHSADVPVDDNRDSTRRAEYAAYALSRDGNPQRGKQVFESSQASCSKCHATSGDHLGPGPTLAAVGDKFNRRELIASILEPSSRIAIGYANTIVLTDGGQAYAGVLQRVTDDWIELVDADAHRVRINVAEIAEQQTSEQSLMPEGLENAVSSNDFADLLAYLESLRQAPSTAESLATPNEIPPCRTPATLRPFFDAAVQFDHPVWMGQVPGAENRYVVLEHAGRSWVVEKRPDGDRQQLLVDLRNVVRVGGATGLLGMAFHPQFATNRKYYLKYQVIEDGQISTVVDERRFDEDAKKGAGAPPRQLLKVPSITQDHNGGCIEFGRDGYLYIGMGDTGPQRDPLGHGQDLGTLLAKLLRIDVDAVEGSQPYAIPPDNPFKDTPSARPEIWAYGFREPWRFTFDRATGDCWVGDVGQDQYEEVTLVRQGENHGWNVFEGFSPFSDEYQRPAATYTPPVLSYPRRLGISVTGGYVYRGRQSPALEGRYIFGDFESRRIWALKASANRKIVDIVEIAHCPARVVSFAQDDAGELYVIGYDDGIIYRIDCSNADLTPLQKETLVETSESAAIPWRVAFSPPPSDWTKDTFDDGAWQTAPGGFGTIGTPAAIVRTDWHTSDIWLRREFDMPSVDVDSAGPSVALRIHHDEDAEVYLNGVEVARLSNWTTGYVDLPLTSQGHKALRPGRNVLAIHCRQRTGGQYIDAGLVRYKP